MTYANLKKQVLTEIEKADTRVLKLIHAMLKANQEVDLWDELPDKVKRDVDAAIKESELGLGKTHQEVMSKYQKWLTK
ncbi:MAG: hypothetical protein KBE91_03035 [Bacteroidia bacterium]|nr:hypothetical protein [Bacteroidia bacterium]MBP9688557.1 hypothetical protein [Bacteroidia bacterium]